MKKGENYLTREDNVKVTANTAIRRWGNSLGIRLPKRILNELNLNENNTLKLSVCGNKLVIEKVGRPKYSNIVERLEDFYKKPISEIYVDCSPEVDTGVSQGNEF